MTENNDLNCRTVPIRLNNGRGRGPINHEDIESFPYSDGTERDEGNRDADEMRTGTFGVGSAASPNGLPMSSTGAVRGFLGIPTGDVNVCRNNLNILSNRYSNRQNEDMRAPKLTEGQYMTIQQLPWLRF